MATNYQTRMLETVEAQKAHIKVATIPSGQSESNVINIEGESIVAIQMPAAWDAASLTFRVSNDNVTFVDLYFRDLEFELLVDADQGHSLEIIPTVGWSYFILRSGTSAGPINQLADRDIIVYHKPV